MKLLEMDVKHGVAGDLLDRDYTDKEVEAATTIQRYARGYLTRKHVKRKIGRRMPYRSDLEGKYGIKQLPDKEDFFDEPENGGTDADEKLDYDPSQNDERKRRDEAAITIQKHYRGYRARKQLGDATNYRAAPMVI